jgi:hypothetical protein
MELPIRGVEVVIKRRGLRHESHHYADRLLDKRIALKFPRLGNSNGTIDIERLNRHLRIAAYS